MKYTEALTELLRMHEFQAKHPDIWQDNPWKGNYYPCSTRYSTHWKDWT